MSILFENRFWYGINLGFELFCPDEMFDEYQLEINILIIKITVLWQG
jgi:hypothetical protein